jgi:UDP-N-acetylglucosamine--N-acetylmuramyl-(pentapeptide) pyrophosphoryl-undecaprenol N-acetylglucosamine transferase
MTFLIAAAGTGGHVYPGISVGEALVDRGVPKADILYVGGSRMEATVFPAEGFPFLGVEIRGLQRSLTPRNLTLVSMVRKSRDRIISAMSERRVKASLGLGGYITIPTGLAARSRRVAFFNSEQNAQAGLANRVAARWARRTFGAFPVTEGLPTAEWVGNPVREPFWRFDRTGSRPTALRRYGLAEGVPVLGVVGGSLGAGVINRTVVDLVTNWRGPEIQVLHITGARYFEEINGLGASPTTVNWVKVGFESSMDLFYAASHLVLTRSGGAVAELTATATPSVLVPGEFGSRGHQRGNARSLTEAGAAITLLESDLPGLDAVVTATLFRPETLSTMADKARRIARPMAAHTIADAMIEAAG